MRTPESGHGSSSAPHHAPYTILAIAIGVRLIAALLVPLAPDETYYWDWSRHLAAGYLDHPPAIALLIRAGTSIFGATRLGVRAGSVAAGAFSSLLLMHLAGALGGDRAKLRGAALIACMPLAQLGLALATPDAPLLLFWSVALVALYPALAPHRSTRSQLLSWMLAGAALGCALESKYTAVLLALGTGLALALEPRARRLLATPSPWAALTVALVIAIPNLAWNAHHEWRTFTFQLSHGLGAHRGSAVQHEARMLGAQIGLVSPLILAMLAAAVVNALTRRDDARRVTYAMIAAVTWLAFALSALRAAVEPSWQAPAYLSAIVLAASHELGVRWRSAVRAAFALGFLTIVAIYVHAYNPFLPANPLLDPTGAGAGWDTLAAHVNIARTGALATTPATWIAGERYQEASELAFHLADHPETFAIDVDARPSQYDFWPSFPQRAHPGDRLVLVLGLYTEPASDPVIAKLTPHFAHVALQEVVGLPRRGRVRVWRRVWVLDGWLGTWPSTMRLH